MYGSAALPNQESILTAMGAALTAWSLADKYTDKWPASKDAAESAANYVDRCHVAPMAPTADGDRWHVEEDYCSHTANTCTCREDAVIDPDFGRLCSHRIAVMMHKSLCKSNAGRLIALIKHFDDNAGEDENRRLVLYMDRYYATGAEDVKYLRYCGRGGQMLRVDQYDQFLVDNAAMIAAARLTGYTLEMAPRKDRQMRYSYILTPIDAANPPANDATYHQEKEERRNRERSLARQFDADLRKNAKTAATAEDDERRMYAMMMDDDAERRIAAEEPEECYR
jgi:hypothetical protein